MRRSGRRNMRRGNVSRRGGQRTILRELQGGPVKGAPDPPQFSRIPWYNLVLEIDPGDAAESQMTLSQLTVAVQKQLLFPDSVHIELRLVKISAYGPVDSSKSVILAVFDPFTEDKAGEVIADLQDAGTGARRPNVHYLYGTAYNHQTVSITAIGPFFEATNAKLIRVSLVWRPRAVAGRLHAPLKLSELSPIKALEGSDTSDPEDNAVN